MSHDRSRRRRERDDHVAERTKLRRPEHGLANWEVKRAKDLRDAGWDCEAIAAELNRPVRSVELALANTRSPNPQNPQACIFTNRTVMARFRQLGLPGEAANAILERLMDEHAHFQRLLVG